MSTQNNPDDPYETARLRMVEEQINRRGVRDPRLLAVLRTLPRHLFVPADELDDAYEDCALPIGLGQTISQPYIVALMTDLLRLKGDETVLEIGTGSGYQAAVLGRLVRQVHSIELHSTLAIQAKARLEALEINNVTIHVGDGSGGLAAFSPYDAILVTAGAPVVPEPLFEQLAPEGRLVLPVGPRGRQVLQRWRKTPAGDQAEELIPVVFVPLRGSYGWKEETD